MTDPTLHHTVTHVDVDAQGRLPLRERLHHIIHRELNSSKNSCGAVPCASRLPDARLTVFVLGGESEYGSHVVRGLTNLAYAPAFDVRVVEWAAVQQCTDVHSMSELLRGAHTVLSAFSCIAEREGRCVDVADDRVWQLLIDACERVGVKRFIPSPFDWDLQLAHPAKKNEQQPELIRRATERRTLLTDQKEKDVKLDYILISIGLLTERLFSPLAGVDVEGGVVRAPAELGWNTRITTTTLDDVARMLPEILLSASSHNAKVRLASGNVTYNEIAQMLELATGKSVQRVDATVTSEQQQAAYREQTDDASATFAVLLEGSEELWWSKGNSWNAGHIPHVLTTPVREWVQQHIKYQNATLGPEFQPNLHTTHTGYGPIPPSPAQLYFSVAPA